MFDKIFRISTITDCSFINLGSVVGTNELPPPYTPTGSGGVPMISCKICSSMISIDGKTHQHVVKCSTCNEASVIFLLNYVLWKCKICHFLAYKSSTAWKKVCEMSVQLFTHLQNYFRSNCLPTTSLVCFAFFHR